MGAQERIDTLTFNKITHNHTRYPPGVSTDSERKTTTHKPFLIRRRALFMALGPAGLCDVGFDAEYACRQYSLLVRVESHISVFLEVKVSQMYCVHDGNTDLPVVDSRLLGH